MWSIIILWLEADLNISSSHVNIIMHNVYVALLYLYSFSINVCKNISIYVYNNAAS